MNSQFRDHRITALIDGPSPRRLILNRWHDRELRMQVVELARELPEAEEFARISLHEKCISREIRLRTRQQAFEALAVDGLHRHTETHPETTEGKRLWQCVVGNSERVKRLKSALKLIEQKTTF